MNSILTVPREIHAQGQTLYVVLERGNYTFVFDKPNTEVQIICLYHVKKGRTFEVSIKIHHKVPNTSCLTQIRGILEDGAVAKVLGKIIIDKQAQGTNSYLKDDTLVLGDNVVHVTEPILQIEANDVKASHGSTTGQINKDQVYYLMSRGLTKKEAEGLIVEGYFAHLLQSINDEKIRKEVERWLK